MHRYVNTRLSSWLDTLDEEIDALKQNHTHVWIIAHSMGATLTIQYLLNNPDKVDGIVLIAPLFKVCNQRSPMLLPPEIWYKIARPCMFFTRVIENPIPVDIHDQASKQYVLSDRFIPRIVYDELFRLLNNIRGAEDKINIPMLMILAHDDVVIDNRAARDFYEHVSVPYKELVILNNTGHVIPLDYNWHDAADKISKFIRDYYTL
jgi:alpha-beta hydrolase superfamily lysophospholipase